MGSAHRKRDTRRIGIGGRELDMPLIVDIGFDSFRRPIGLNPHRHEGFEVTYLSAGEVTWLVKGGHALHLSGGDMAVTQPGFIHHGEWNIIRPCTLFWIILEPQRADATENTPFDRAFLKLVQQRMAAAGNTVMPAGETLAGLFRKLHEDMVAFLDGVGDAFLLPELRAVLAQILTECARGFATPHGREPASDRVERAIAFIRRRFADPVGVADVAAAAGVSASRLHTLFKAQTGLTPADYLLRIRCAHARSLLRGSSASITQIAFDCGFSSSQYFAQCFKKFTGMTPSVFRSRSRKSEVGSRKLGVFAKNEDLGSEQHADSE